MLLALALAAAQPAAPRPASPSPVVAPTSDAERMALAASTVNALLPPGSYAKLMTDTMGASTDMMMAGMLDMTPEQLGAPEGEGKAKSGKGETLRDALRKEDPHFEERMRIMNRIMGEELGRISGKFEPALREGLTRSMARRFTAAQLRDINGFFATASGRLFAAESIKMWADPEIMTAMAKSAPTIIAEMPAIMKKVEAATDHLPPPPKRKTDGKDEADESVS